MATTFTLVTVPAVLMIFFFSNTPPHPVLASKGHLERCPPYELLRPCCYCNSIPKYFGSGGGDGDDDDERECSSSQAVVHNSARCQAPVITCIGGGGGGDHLEEDLGNAIGRTFSRVTAHTVNPLLRRFEWLYLVDDHIKVLPAEAFAGGLHFRHVYIKAAPSLLVINETAFGGLQNTYTQSLFINATALADVPRLRRATFRAVGAMRALEVLEFQATNFTVVPFKAFNGPGGGRLKVVRFYNPDRRGGLTTIGTRAFHRAHFLEEIDLKNNRISVIKAYAFAFQRPANRTLALSVYLSGNRLHSDSFALGALLGGNGRNVTLYLGGYDGGCNRALATLRREVFEPFLEESPGNIVDMYGCPLLCDHRMEWLTFRLERYRAQVRNLECYVHSAGAKDSSLDDSMFSSSSAAVRVISKDNYYHVD